MSTSAWALPTISAATASVDRRGQRHDPAEGRHGVALEGPVVGGQHVAGDRRPARVGVLHDDRRGRTEVRQLVGEAPGGVGVVEVEVGQLQPAVLDHVVPPAGLPGHAVAGAPLVRVLAVAQRLGLLQRQVDRGGQVRRRRRWLRTSWRWRRRRRRCARRRRRPGGGAARRTARRRCVALSRTPRISRGRPPSPRGPSSWRRPAPWSDPRRRSARSTGWTERVQVADDQADRLDVLGGEVGEVGRVGEIGQDAGVERGWRVLTRPPSISGAPVTDSTVRCGMPAPARAAAVPPLAMNS